MEPENDEKHRRVQIEIALDKLESLFSKGLLCAAEFRCLNESSKKSIWKLCLNSCSAAGSVNYLVLTDIPSPGHIRER